MYSRNKDAYITASLLIARGAFTTYTIYNIYTIFANICQLNDSMSFFLITKRSRHLPLIVLRQTFSRLFDSANPPPQQRIGLPAGPESRDNFSNYNLFMQILHNRNHTIHNSDICIIRLIIQL